MAHLDAGVRGSDSPRIRIHCGAWRFSGSVPIDSGEEELVSAEVQRGRMKKIQRPAPTPSPLKGLKDQDSYGKGRGSLLPSCWNPMTTCPPVTPQLTATSSAHFLVSAQLTPNPCIHLFVQQTSSMLSPQETSVLSSFFRSNQSRRKTEPDTGTPSLMESGQGQSEGQGTGSFPGEETLELGFQHMSRSLPRIPWQTAFDFPSS